MITRNITSAEHIDDKLVLCKAVTAIKSYFGERYVTRRQVMYVLVKTVKLKKPETYVKKYVPLEGIDKEKAQLMFNILVDKGYLEFSHLFDPKGHPNIKIATGEKMYKINPLSYAECTETSWFKNRQRKERFLTKEASVDKRSCRALQQIYVMFGNMPFSYNTVTETSRMVLQLSTKQGITKASGDRVEFTPAEKAALDHMKAKLYGYEKNSFKQVWQSLIRNGFVTPHKIKSPDGYIKKTGLYKINQAYIKYCLGEMM
jgi:hypothetical protein